MPIAMIERRSRAWMLKEWKSLHEEKAVTNAGLAIPRRGHVLSTVVEVYGRPIREAVAVVAASLAKTDCSERRKTLLLPRPELPEADFERADEEIAAWAVISMWVTGVAVRAISPEASLAEAECWFFGAEAFMRDVPGNTMEAAEAMLRTTADASAYFQLLPYILDPHGPGSRLSVRRDPITQSARSRKRNEGVFYTPADVAEYMVNECITVLSHRTLPTIFDPACGTGVFLRAALREIRRQHPDRNAFALARACLFGADVDPWPLDATAFVLLADSWIDSAVRRVPAINAWRQLRSNLACIDTLRIDGPETSASGTDAPSKRSMCGNGRVPISSLFPALKTGPTIILGNPPYANIGPRSDLADITRAFKTLSVNASPRAEIYLPFIEQMIKLGDPNLCTGALVLPLSIACNVGRQFSMARELISNTPGHWRFTFFDREPHALFGEDVKTRNAIIHWSRTPSDKSSTISTGPLRKWRAQDRATMFKCLRFTNVEKNIRAGIPKIDGDIQAAALRALEARWTRLGQAVHTIGRANLSDVPRADEQTVFVGPTAYNFINVFVRSDCGICRSGQTLSEHSLHAIRCSSRADTLAVFAVLSSHLTYWWWHTHGDGFHVSRRFLVELPFGMEIFTPPVRDVLAEHGAELWALMEQKPIISLNRGKISLAYTPNEHDGIRRKIDQALADLVGLEGDFVDELQQFTKHTVTATLRVTVTEEKRQHGPKDRKKEKHGN